MTRCAVAARRETAPRLSGTRVRRRCDVVLVAAAMFLGACDFPTALPRFETRMVVPLETTRLTAAELLPGGITLAGNAFQIAVNGSTTQRTLGQMCGAPCAGLQGLQAAKPAFTDAFTIVLPLPADVAGGTITGGSAQVTLSHNFDFDPLRPPGSTQNGSLTVTLRSAGVALGSTTIDQAFPRNTPVVRTVPLAGVASGAVEVVLSLVSPAGGTVLINNNAAVNVSIAPLTVTASEALVRVQDRPVSAQPVTLDLTRVDQGIRDRVRRGALVLEISNPFPVTGTLQVRLRAPTSGADIQRSVVLSGQQTTHRLELSEAEVQSLLGHQVIATVSGPVTAPGGPIAIRPDQQLVLTPRLDLVLEIGS